jgi:hypothetical protein
MRRRQVREGEDAAGGEALPDEGQQEPGVREPHRAEDGEHDVKRLAPALQRQEVDGVGRDEGEAASTT